MSDLTTEEKVMLTGDFVLSMKRTELRAKTLLKGENVLCTYLHVLRQPVARQNDNWNV